MEEKELTIQCEKYLKLLCEEIPERSVGSQGNRDATQFFQKEIASLGWHTRTEEFDAIDWFNGGAELDVNGLKFPVNVSPYSIGCDIKAELVKASSIEELKNLDARGKIILLIGQTAKEQLMPKNFIFYNPQHHKEIISLLEKSGAKGIIGATGWNVNTAGGVYPFPLIEDGDFNIPSVYMKDIDGDKLLNHCGEIVSLKSTSKRIPGKGYNVIAVKGKNSKDRIVVSAHIDAKKGTPGAIDNATGVTSILLLAKLLKHYNGEKQIEIAAFNGEDYYAVPGQMNYLAINQNRFDEIKLNINIDGAGFKEGGTAFSFFSLPNKIKSDAESVMKKFSTINEGIQWVQGDHSIFVQNGCPAIAVTSQWFLDNMETQDVTHTPKDNLSIVESKRIVEIAQALYLLLILLCGE